MGLLRNVAAALGAQDVVNSSGVFRPFTDSPFYRLALETSPTLCIILSEAVLQRLCRSSCVSSVSLRRLLIVFSKGWSWSVFVVQAALMADGWRAIVDDCGAVDAL